MLRSAGLGRHTPRCQHLQLAPGSLVAPGGRGFPGGELPRGSDLGTGNREGGDMQHALKRSGAWRVTVGAALLGLAMFALVASSAQAKVVKVTGEQATIAPSIEADPVPQRPRGRGRGDRGGVARRLRQPDAADRRRAGQHQEPARRAGDQGRRQVLQGRSLAEASPHGRRQPRQATPSSAPRSEAPPGADRAPHQPPAPTSPPALPRPTCASAGRWRGGSTTSPVSTWSAPARCSVTSPRR